MPFDSILFSGTEKEGTGARTFFRQEVNENPARALRDARGLQYFERNW